MDQDKEFTTRDRRADATDSANPGQDAVRPAEIDFSAFVLSLATSVQINLGNVPHPETNQSTQDIAAAKQMIGILGMLQEKTRGNLSKEEDTLLGQVLFNLRMHYVRVAEGQKKSGGS